MSVLSRKNLTTAYNAEHTCTAQHSTAQHSTAQHSTALEVHPFLYNHIRNVRQHDTGHILDTLFFFFIGNVVIVTQCCLSV